MQKTSKAKTPNNAAQNMEQLFNNFWHNIEPLKISKRHDHKPIRQQVEKRGISQPEVG